MQALFLCPHSRVMAGCAGAPSGAPVSLYAGPPILCNPPPLSAWRQTVAVPQYKDLHA
ncbi:hypothetical protein GHO29_05490 [Pseudomonas helleri]|uniref:Uncharacterized protein n=1 Tax=Pseudomonas helleri TaxID=1608996 RepID=A0A7X1XYE5_9PSED|nr:hypothetical protein [Pseudomonas helleri]